MANEWQKRSKIAKKVSDVEKEVARISRAAEPKIKELKKAVANAAAPKIKELKKAVAKAAAPKIRKPRPSIKTGADPTITALQKQLDLAVMQARKSLKTTLEASAKKLSKAAKKL